MAKQQSGSGEVNKSALAREILEKDINTPVKDVVSTLAGRGVSISPNMVYLIKGRMKKKSKREKRQRAVAASKEAGIANPVHLILEVRKVAERAGGMRQLKQLVDLLAE